MTTAGDSRIRFSEVEQLELVEYRPVNRFALTAFLLGWLSSLALIHPVLCILPLTGGILAILSLRQLSAADCKQSGRSIAVMGLALSILFGSWAVARESSRDLHLYAQGRQFAEQWFNLLSAGKVHEAHQLTLPEENRAAGGISLVEHYSLENPENDPRPKMAGGDMGGMMEMSMRPSAELETFFLQHVHQRLQDLGKKATYTYRGNVHVLGVGNNATEVELAFDVSYASDGQTKTFPVRVILIRQLKPGLAGDWRIVKVIDADEA